VTRADRLAVAWLGAAGAAFALAGTTGAAVSGAALVALLADGVARPASGVLLPVISHGPRGRRQVALTFDDGPDPRTTPVIASALERAGGRATFFCIGRHAAAHRDLAAALAAAGHELGNHSWSHPRTLNLRSRRTMADEIARGSETLRDIAGGPEPLYRPPIGLKNPALASIAAARGLRVVTWSLHGHDTGGAAPEAIAARVLARVRPGDIVCLHDGCDRGDASRAATAAAVPLILRGLAERDLAPVTVSTLLGPELYSPRRHE
jgi:peptidoglycan/xylan/chitin deacetylase (PgdA/CDA1 family)